METNLIAKQTLQIYHAALTQTLDATLAVQDQSQKTLESLLDQSPVVPAGGKAGDQRLDRGLPSTDDGHEKRHRRGVQALQSLSRGVTAGLIENREKVRRTLLPSILLQARTVPAPSTPGEFIDTKRKPNMPNTINTLSPDTRHIPEVRPVLARSFRRHGRSRQPLVPALARLAQRRQQHRHGDVAVSHHRNACRASCQRPGGQSRRNGTGDGQGHGGRALHACQTI